MNLAALTTVRGGWRYSYWLDVASGSWWCHTDVDDGSGEWLPGWAPRPASLAEAAAACGWRPALDRQTAAVGWLAGMLASRPPVDETAAETAALALCRLAGDLAATAAGSEQPCDGRAPEC